MHEYFQHTTNFLNKKPEKGEKGLLGMWVSSHKLCELLQSMPFTHLGNFLDVSNGPTETIIVP